MLTCKSPRKVMLVAHFLASQSLPQYSSEFSRHDFTLPQLFACLAVKEQMKRSYRGAETLLRDGEHWCKAIGMRKVPDHNTLCRAASLLLRKCRVDRLLDAMARWAAVSRMLGLSIKPLALDSTYYESHHVSRYYEGRCRQRRKGEKGRKSRRSQTVRRLPKLAVAVCAKSHLVLSMWTGTGMGGDHPHFEKLMLDAWSRVPHRRFKAVADAGYDSEANHEVARRDMGLRSVIPPEIGRRSKSGAPPTGRWRRRMKGMLSTQDSRKRCGYTQRWQVETVNSMMKRNQGSALAGKTVHSRKRDLALKVLTHNAMIFKRGKGRDRAVTSSFINVNHPNNGPASTISQRSATPSQSPPEQSADSE
jgi:Transposase DDE domain